MGGGDAKVLGRESGEKLEVFTDVFVERKQFQGGHIN